MSTIDEFLNTGPSQPAPAQQKRPWEQDWTVDGAAGDSSSGKPWERDWSGQTVAGAPSKRPQRSWAQAAGDTVVQLAEGVNTVIGAVPDLVAPESDTAQFFRDNARYWRDQQSDPLKQRIATADQAIDAAGEEGVISQIAEAAGQYFSDPALAARFVTTNLPSMIPGIGAAKLAQAGALARGATAAKAASVATTAAGATNAVLNAGGARGEAFEDIKRTLQEQGFTAEQAEAVALADSRVVAAVGGVAGFVSGKTGLEGSLVGKAGAGGAWRAGGRALAAELGGEQIEEVAPKITTNVMATRYDGRSVGQDVGRTMVETAIGSGPGAVVAGVSTAGQVRGQAGELELDLLESAPATGQATQPVATPKPPRQENPAVRLAELDLLRQDRPLTELERSEAQTLVQRLDAAEQALMQGPTDAETTREAMTAIKGAQTEFSTEAGVRLAGEYALVSADDLLTSHDENLRANPLYPKELQPRDRSRSASEIQVSGIVQKLDPARLGLSADAATGAPIVGADGLVESGNARTIALKRVYQANGQKAADYKAWLQQNAQQFGLTPEMVSGMAKPVLVRVRSTPVNRAEFARQANASTVQRMSPAEQAAADAKRLASLEGLEPDEMGDFASSHDFIRQFMATLPVTEQSEMIESDGRLSTAGYRRIQNAVLAKAYGDSPTLRRMTESLDNRLVNISKALVRVAPTIAAARERMQAGSLYEADIAPDLVQAVEGLSALKDKGWTVEQELGQVDLTGPKYSPEATELLRFLADNARSPRRIAEFLQRYHGALEAAGDPNQGSLLGDTGPAPTRSELLQQAKGPTNATDIQPAAATEQPAAGPGPAPAPAAVGGQEPGSTPGRGNRAQGDEGQRTERPAAVGDGLSVLREQALQVARTGAFAKEGLTFEERGENTAILFKGQEIATLQGQRSRGNIVKAIKTAMGETGALRQPSVSDVLAQQDRRQQADRLDERQQIRRESEAGADQFQLTRQDGRQDTTGQLFGQSAKDAPAKTQIEDVGQQLYANRRNFTGRGLNWDDVQDLNDTLKLKEVTKAKVWPRPDYEQLVADGMPPVVARLVKQVYDGLSAGPTMAGGNAPSDADLQRYINTLRKVREALFAFVNDRQRVAEFAQGVLASVKRDAPAIGPVSVLDLARQPMDPQGVATVLLRQVWPEQFAEGVPTMGRFRRGSDAHQDVAIVGGNKALGALQFARKDLSKWVADLENGWPAKREAWQVQGYRVLGPDEYRLDRYDGARGVVHYIRPVLGRGSWGRSQPFAGGKFALVLDGGSFAQEFDTREAAIEAAREKVKRQASAGQDVRGTNIQEAERTGPARREEGEDISAQQLMDAFGFRGVNFGREGWIKQAERQEYLNQAYDALIDLADILGVPPKAMSLDGKLGIAFGAQGKGKHAAHFVPGYNEINLTRTKGAGTLAHEWGHALDHYFGVLAGLEKDSEPFLSEHASKGDKTSRMVFEGGRYVSQKDVPTFGDGIRPEIVRAFREIYQAMEKRAESMGEATMRRRIAQDRAAKGLTQWLRVARTRIEESAASNKADLLAEFDQHAQALREGDTGDGYQQSGKQAFSARVAAVRNLIKDATGRVWSLDETNGLEASARYVRSLAGKQDADTAHEPQKVASQYKADSRAMDMEKGGKAYWSTPTEMFARAFELYVHDALARRGQQNTFLTDAQRRASTPVQVADTSNAAARAAGATRDLYLYPVGNERETLGQAFDALVGQIQTRETDQGVALYARKDDTYTDSNGPDDTKAGNRQADIDALETIVDDGNRAAVAAGRARSAREVHPFRWVRLPDGDGLDAIAAAFGKRVVGFDVAAGVLSREFGFFNGVTRPGRDNRIFLNAKSDRPHLAVLGHELAHQLKRDRSDLFDELVSAIRPYVKAREYGEAFARSAVARDSYPPGATAQQRDAAVREEFIGEVLSDGFTERAFWRALGDQNPSLLQRIGEFLADLIDRIRTAAGYTPRTERFLTDYERVMSIAGQVMSEYGLQAPARDGGTGPAAFNRADGPADGEAFRRWFGGSVVTEADGRPAVVYHGTKRDFSEFKSGAGIVAASGGGAASELGFFFSNDLAYVDGLIGHPSDPEAFADGANVMPVYLALRNPKIEPMQKIQDIEESWSAERARRYRKHLESKGHDGIIFEGVNANEYVVFKAEQVKSSVGNRGTFDPAERDVRFLRNGQTAPVGPAQQNLWTRAKAKVLQLTSPAAIDRLLYEFQDKLIDLRRLRDHIQSIGGTITDLNDAYLGEELYHKRLAKRTSDFLDTELRPLLADMRARAVKLPELERYLHARHAPEANRALAERNPNRQRLDELQRETAKEVRDLEGQLQRAKANGSATTAIEEALELAREEAATWRGAQPFAGSEDERRALSGMSDAEAQSIMDGLSPRKRMHLEVLAARVDAIQAKTLEHLEEYGLMDKGTLGAWRSAYQFYVPLHRDEARPESDRHPIGQGFSVKGSGTKSRVGSNEKVTNILAHIAMQREAALTRGEKNNVVKKLYLMAAQNPDDEVWKLDAPPRVKTVDPRSGIVRTTIDPTYKHRPNVVMVRIAGRDKAVVFNEHNPSAVRLAESMKNLDIGDLHVVLGLAAKGTRWFASVNTQYNPIFGLINFARDVQAGLLNLSTTPIAGKEKEVAKHVLTAMRAIYRQRRGKASRNRQWTALWEDFERVGGTTGYRDLFADAEDRAKALVKDLEALDRGQVSKAAHAVVDWLSDYNEVMENSVRLSAYKVAIEQGMSKERAASLAKNLTVNFNRKGRQARELGALYAFFNAALQGTARMVDTLKGPIGRRIIYGGVALGALNTLIGMAMMGAGDDDEADNWEKIPEFIKERSLVIPLGREDYLSIPMPLGFHVFPNIGRLAVEFAFGDEEKSAGRRIADLLSIMVDAFNPLGGAQNLGQMAAPTVLDPVVALMQNRDWTGRPIYREDFSDLDPSPGHTRTKDSASTVSRALAQAINAVTGGTEYQPGAWSPTPDQIDYVFGQLTGGLGRELIKVNQTVAATVTGDELPPYKVPLLGRLYGNTRGPSGQSEKYYENIRAINLIESEIQGRRRQREDVQQLMQDEPLTGLVLMGRRTETMISRLRQRRRIVVEQRAAGYEEEVARLDERIGEAMTRLNNEVTKARRAAEDRE